MAGRGSSISWDALERLTWSELGLPRLAFTLAQALVCARFRGRLGFVCLSSGISKGIVNPSSKGVLSAASVLAGQLSRFLFQQLDPLRTVVQGP